jgi:hypothetical protein
VGAHPSGARNEVWRPYLRCVPLENTTSSFLRFACFEATLVASVTSHRHIDLRALPIVRSLGLNGIGLVAVAVLSERRRAVQRHLGSFFLVKTSKGDIIPSGAPMRRTSAAIMLDAMQHRTYLLSPRQGDR